MSSYIKSLTASVDAKRAKREAEYKERAAAEQLAVRERMAPLDVRLRRLLETVPAPVQAEGLSLMALRTQLKARGRGHNACHVGELGAALRKLGFMRRRQFRDGAAGFQALWFPAEDGAER